MKDYYSLSLCFLAVLLASISLYAIGVNMERQTIYNKCLEVHKAVPYGEAKEKCTEITGSNRNI